MRLQTVKCEVSSWSESVYCKKHPNERGNYFCLSCHTIVCTACIVNEHADHQASDMTALLRQQQQDVEGLRDVVRDRNETLRKRLAQLESLRLVRTPCPLKSTQLYLLLPERIANALKW